MSPLDELYNAASLADRLCMHRAGKATPGMLKACRVIVDTGHEHGRISKEIKMIFDEGDANRVVFENENWQIRWHCNRGYEPWWTLHKRRRFLCFSWWKFCNFGDYTSLIDEVNRFESAFARFDDAVNDDDNGWSR